MGRIEHFENLIINLIFGTICFASSGINAKETGAIRRSAVKKTPTQLIGCPTSPTKNTNARNEDGTESEVKFKQLKVGKGCLEIELTSNTKNDGEYAEYSWSAQISYYEAGSKISLHTLGERTEMNSFENTANGFSIVHRDPARCFSSGFNFENDTTTEEAISVKNKEIMVKSRVLSSKRIFCPPHPEGLPGCVMSCLMGKYEAVKDVCEKSESKCDRAMVNYVKKHGDCPSTCGDE